MATAGTFVSGITVSDGRGSNTNLDAGTVSATIGSGVTVVTYTNDVNPILQFGYVEVCKDAGDALTLARWVGERVDEIGAPYLRMAAQRREAARRRLHGDEIGGADALIALAQPDGDLFQQLAMRVAVLSLIAPELLQLARPRLDMRRRE